MIIASKSITSIIMIIFSMVHLYWGTQTQMSPNTCAGMVYGGALPKQLEREVVIVLNGTPFGQATVTTASAESIADDLAILRDYPNDETMNRIAQHLLSRPWQDPTRTQELIWKVKLPPSTPILVEDWHVAPPELNLVDVQSLEINVFELTYDLQQGMLTTNRIAWLRKSKNELE